MTSTTNNNQASLSVDWPELVKRLIDLIFPRSDDVLSSPSKLGELLTICHEFAEIEPIIRERAETLALQKKEISGWTLVHRDGNGYVESADVHELLAGCPLSQLPRLMAAIDKLLGNLSAAKWKELCHAIGRLDDDRAIKQSGATVFLRRNPNPNKES
jgi:hypothetical protein